MNTQMRNFDEFTVTISDGDPIKRTKLERGTVTDYWDTAVHYVTRLATAKEQADKASKKSGLPSRRG